MKLILVATDFSTRSDRAMRRAALLARRLSASLVLVHVIDDDQPRRLVEAQREDAGSLMEDLVRSLRHNDNLECEPRVVLGDPFRAIVQSAEDAGVDLVVLGPHRRQLLRDMFVGTTAERTIRHSRRPVIMANAVPARDYARVLVATDLSECSATAVGAARQLGLLKGAQVSVVHAFDAPAQSMLVRGSATGEQLKAYLNEQGERARGELAAFLRKVKLTPQQRIVALTDSDAAAVIRRCARDTQADLIVVGTRGRSGIEGILLGSVAAAVLRDAEFDVLAVPASHGE